MKNGTNKSNGNKWIMEGMCWQFIVQIAFVDFFVYRDLNKWGIREFLFLCRYIPYQGCIKNN
jgi:hypothetical protein